MQFIFTIRWFRYLLICFNISVGKEVQAVISVSEDKHVQICENDNHKF